MSANIKKIWNVIASIIVALVVIIAVLLVGVRVIGFEPYSVLTGSMEPELPVGSLVYVKECEPEDVKPGDTITFVLNEDLDVATHKVDSVDAENKVIYTYGIANKDANGEYIMDGGTHFNNVIGKPVFSIPYLGYVSAWIMSPPGNYIAIGGIVLLFVIAFVPDIVSKFSKKKEKQ